MSRIVIYTPDGHILDHHRRLYHQLRLLLTNEYGAAVDFCPINAPWVMRHTKACPPDGAIVWNGYGGQFALQLVEYLKRQSIPFIRMEQGWMPQRDHCYFSKELGAYSELPAEILHKQWPVDWDAWNRYRVNWMHQPEPGLPKDYILVCGQVPGDSNLVSLTCPRKDIPRLVREKTDSPVVYRPHPKHPEPSTVDGVINVSADSALYPQLAHARAVVAGTSTCLLEAALFGTPAISLGLGVWTDAAVRHATPLTLEFELDRATDGWSHEAREHCLAVLHQHAEVSWRKPRFRSPRIRSLLKGLL